MQRGGGARAALQFVAQLPVQHRGGRGAAGGGEGLVRDRGAGGGGEDELSGDDVGGGPGRRNGGDGAGSETDRGEKNMRVSEKGTGEPGGSAGERTGEAGERD